MNLVSLNKIYIFLVVKFLWKFKSIKHNAIRSFQATEDDGVWHLHQVFNSTYDPKIKADVFTHILEEDSHASLFKKVYEQESKTNFTRQYYEREDLLPDDKDLWRKIAYVHVGERDATARFKTIISYLNESPLKKTLRTIVADEEGHIDLTYGMIEQYHDNVEDIKKEVARIDFLRMKDALARSINRIANMISSIFLYILFLCVAPFCFIFVRKKFDLALVEYDNNYIKKLKT